MTPVALWLAFISLAFSALHPDKTAELHRINQLKQYLRKERPQYEKREFQKKNLIESLDRLNSDQNEVRKRILDTKLYQTELSMAVDNFSIELQKQREVEAFERQRLLLLMKVLYQIKRDGIFRFIISGENLSGLATRIGLVYKTLKSRSKITSQMVRRSARLAKTEKKLSETKGEFDGLLVRLDEDKNILKGILRRKKKLLSGVNRKQKHFKAALSEYKRISKQLRGLFTNFELGRRGSKLSFPKKKSLSLPVEAGRIVKRFGRSVHKKFRTVTYQKGIQIEADYLSPVSAVLPGTVEYAGWVKGLGNVVIIHHGGGFYSLSAHLHKNLALKGDRVQRGDTVALVGDTGSSEKPGLYFELREKSQAVNPIAYFSSSALKKLN